MGDSEEESTPTGELLATFGHWFNAVGLCLAFFFIVGGAIAREWGFFALGLACVVAYAFSRYMTARQSPQR